MEMANNRPCSKVARDLPGRVSVFRRSVDARGLFGNGVVNPVQLDTDVAGIREIRRNVVELVARQRQLQPRERQQRKPGGPAQRFLVERIVVLVQHRLSSAPGCREYRQEL